MQLNSVSVVDHPIWCIIEFWGTATFIFHAVTIITPWTLRNTIKHAKFRGSFLNQVAEFYEYLSQIHIK